MTFELREYQRQALEAEARHRAEHPDETRLAIVMATGLGKGTIIAERAVRAIEDPMFSGRVLILAPTDEIVSDLAARCRLMASRSEFPISVGIVKAEQDEHSADIVVASVQTLLDPGRRARIADVGLVLVDECEAYVAPQWRKVLEHFGCFARPCEHVGVGRALDSLGGHCTDCMDTGLEYGGTMATPALGFTATLERGDGASLGEVWQNVAFTRDISWGVRKGYLVQPIGHRLEIDFRSSMGFVSVPLSIDPWQQDRQLIDGMAPEKIVEKWIELAKGRPTVAFMPLVRSATALMEAFWKEDIPAGV